MVIQLSDGHQDGYSSHPNPSRTHGRDAQDLANSMEHKNEGREHAKAASYGSAIVGSSEARRYDALAY